jgi:hypothetical protein
VQAQLARQAEFHKSNLQSYKEAREAYLKKVGGHRPHTCRGLGMEVPTSPLPLAFAAVAASSQDCCPRTCA